MIGQSSTPLSFAQRWNTKWKAFYFKCAVYLSWNRSQTHCPPLCLMSTLQSIPQKAHFHPVLHLFVLHIFSFIFAQQFINLAPPLSPPPLLIPSHIPLFFGLPPSSSSTAAGLRLSLLTPLCHAPSPPTESHGDPKPLTQAHKHI